MGSGQKDQFVLKLFAQEVGETLLILILKETHDMGDAQKRIFVLKTFLILILKETTLQMEMVEGEIKTLNKTYVTLVEEKEEEITNPVTSVSGESGSSAAPSKCCSNRESTPLLLPIFFASSSSSSSSLLCAQLDYGKKETAATKMRPTTHPKKKKECRVKCKRRRKKTNKIGCCVWKNPKFMKTST
jgi:hypothetical protein